MSRSPAGYTLIEVMIVVSIIGILSVSAVPFFHDSYRAYVRARAEQDIARSALPAVALIEEDVRQSRRAAASPRSSLTLETPSLLPGHRLSTDAVDRIVYGADPRDRTVLLKQVFPAPGSLRMPARQVLARNLAALAFSVEEPSLVSWRASFGSGSSVRSFASSAGLRNRSGQ